MEDAMAMGDGAEIVPDIEGYERLTTPLLQRLAAEGDEQARVEVARRQPPPDGAHDPDRAPGGGPRALGDAVVNDMPYYAMPVQLLRNLVDEGDAGAMDELERRGVPVDPPA
jgi:hypothetical protein